MILLIPLINQMRTASLLNDLKELKQSKPSIQPPKNTKRIERYLIFQQENGINLKQIDKKKHIVKQGLFKNMSFCFPLIDPLNDLEPSKLAQLAKVIHLQGGRIVQYSNDMQKKQVQYILIDRRSDFNFIREQIKHRVSYSQIIDYKWIEECLRMFKKVPISQYKLERIFDMSQEKVKSMVSGQKSCQQVNIFPNKQKNQENQQRNNQVSYLGGLENQSYEFDVGEQESCTEIIEQQKKQCIQKAQQIQIKSDNQSILKQQNYKHEHLQQALLQMNEAKLQHLHTDFQANQINPALEKTQDKNQDSESEKTQKMDSDDQNNNHFHKGYYRTSRQKQAYKKQQQGQPTKMQTQQSIQQIEPQNRKKTKLAIGSHNFSVNNGIVQLLKKMQSHYQAQGNRKSFAYLRAIACIKNYGKEITNADELRNIEGIGKEMVEKVRQYLKSGCIKKINQKVNTQISVPYKDLLRVHGIGPTTAEELYHRGIKTIQDLQKNQQLLNKNQKLGLKYLNDFQKRIPRQKVGRMLQFVKQTLFYVVRSDSRHEIEAVGSYRRGKATCGDMDILITRRDGYVQRSLLFTLVTQLQKRKFITDHITNPKPYDGHCSVNYMGVCCFQDETHHRIDLKHYPVQQYAFALLYFTGSDLFNREMRMHAHEKGLMLSDHNVKKKQRNGQGKIWRGGKIPVCYTEKDIFDLLEMEFRAPAQREL